MIYSIMRSVGAHLIFLTILIASIYE